MPSFRGRLSEEQARALVARLRRAAPGFVPAGRPGAEPDEFDRRFEELEEELDRLKKEFHEAADGPKPPGK